METENEYIKRLHLASNRIRTDWRSVDRPTKEKYLKRKAKCERFYAAKQKIITTRIVRGYEDG